MGCGVQKRIRFESGSAVHPTRPASTKFIYFDQYSNFPPEAAFMSDDGLFRAQYRPYDHHDEVFGGQS